MLLYYASIAYYCTPMLGYAAGPRRQAIPLHYDATTLLYYALLRQAVRHMEERVHARVIVDGLDKAKAEACRCLYATPHVRRGAAVGVPSGGSHGPCASHAACPASCRRGPPAAVARRRGAHPRRGRRHQLALLALLVATRAGRPPTGY